MPHISSRSSGGNRPVRTCMYLFLLGTMAFLYWQLFPQGAMDVMAPSTSQCPFCVCNCPSLPPKDCSGIDPIMREEMERNFVDLLSEELKEQLTVADDAKQKANYTFQYAKKLSLEYRKEAEKCNLAMETCEEAREKAEQDLSMEKKITALWEVRAKVLGWQEE